MSAVVAMMGGIRLKETRVLVLGRDAGLDLLKSLHLQPKTPAFIPTSPLVLLTRSQSK
jgi:hypothetical protein